MTKYTLTDLIALIDAIGYEFHSSHLIGNAPPSHTKRYKRMSDPQPGDLVIELSTGPMRLRNGGNPLSPPHNHICSEYGVGILLRVTQEPAYTEEEWNESEEGSPIPTEEVWYLRLLETGEEFRWTNARFVTIIPREGWEPWAKVLSGLEKSEVTA